ncbi:MAG: prolyl aminopeptidase [Rhodospirillaceae bacterium TMED8]|nr:prolyl aminopeptidase [Magnetovibrio sp.]OUT52183.1 MAG: prolyl aminopeptidase [Rhodospirillaceae bacterium TMED8]
MLTRDLNSEINGNGDLFPALDLSRHGMLDVGDGHRLYWEESGNSSGIPVVFLHGGPGAGTSPVHRRFFDPTAYRIILFDQRGAGKSTPYAKIEANTTTHLIEDIEVLRRFLDIEKWLVFGGSWGATLSIAYALRHTECCLGLILRGVFLGRPSELNWFFGGAAKVFPDAWERFLNYLPEQERNDPLRSYYRRLIRDEEDMNLSAARAWNAYETACSTLKWRGDILPSGSASLGLARIEAHYFINRMFLAEDLMLAAADLGDFPGAIIQGRYDMVCPMETAFTLHRLWPGSRLEIVNDAGHSAMEPGIRCALVKATETFKRLGGFGKSVSSA